MCKSCRMYMAIWCQVWTFVSSKYAYYTKHLDTNTSSKKSVYSVQLYGSPVHPRLKIAKSGRRLSGKGLNTQKRSNNVLLKLPFVLIFCISPNKIPVKILFRFLVKKLRYCDIMSVFSAVPF